MRAAASLPDVLDPARESVDAGSPLATWWEMQRRYALRPERLPERWPAAGPAAWAPPSAPPALGAPPTEALARSLAASGWRALPRESAHYPASLRAIADPPPLLWIRGALDALAAPRIAVVGARRCTGYGRRCADTFGAALAERGVAVVSGLAHGVDAAAHRGALRSGATLAVLAHGPDRLYPAAHRALADEVAARGALISEFPPGLSPRPAFFPLRNRTISGLSTAVLVVEARRRSGSLVTARHALTQGREVLAVPGPIDVETSEGSNLLLREGAAPALGPEDLLPLVDSQLPPRAGARADVQAPGSAASDPRETTSHTALCRLLRARPAAPDEIAERLGWAPDAVARAVVELEMDGIVETGPDGSVSLRRR